MAKTKTINEKRSRHIAKYVKKFILDRDNNCCMKCGVYMTDNLHMHHIFDMQNFPDLWKVRSNIITLCEQCHIANKNYPNSFHSVYPAIKSNTLTDLENWLGLEYKYRDELLKEYNKYYQ